MWWKLQARCQTGVRCTISGGKQENNLLRWGMRSKVDFLLRSKVDRGIVCQLSQQKRVLRSMMGRVWCSGVFLEHADVPSSCSSSFNSLPQVRGLGHVRIPRHCASRSGALVAFVPPVRL